MPSTSRLIERSPFPGYERVAVVLPRRRAVFARVFATTVVVCTVGGGVVGVASVGLATVFGIAGSLPAGVVLGGFFSVPIALGAALTASRPDPPRSPSIALFRGGAVGAAIAFTPSFLANMYLLVAVMNRQDAEPLVTAWWALNAAFALAACVVLGQGFGRVVARSYLRAYRLTAASPAPLLWRTPGSPACSVWVQDLPLG